jgi:phosphoglycolate phosphatase
MQIQDDAFDLVLFDLDGTVLDTAPDMVGALQTMQRDFGVAPVNYETARNTISANGSVGLVALAFPDAGEDEHHDLLCEYVERYRNRLSTETVLFPGIEILLQTLDDGDLPWGIITNKPEGLSRQLLDELDLAERCNCIIGGDTLPVKKPEPEPLLLGAEYANVEPHRALYIGDAERDIEAGRRAGMATIAAAYGYIHEDDDPREWEPDAIVLSPQELTQMVLKAVRLQV